MLSVLALLWGKALDIGLKVFGFLLDHWKATAVAIVAGSLFFAGYRLGTERENGYWVEKWDKRNAAELAAAEEHERQLAALRASMDEIERKHQLQEAARLTTYASIDKEVAAYVAFRTNLDPVPAGTCPADHDIGPDGLRLIELARQARYVRADPGH